MWTAVTTATIIVRDRTSSRRIIWWCGVWAGEEGTASQMRRMMMMMMMMMLRRRRIMVIEVLIVAMSLRPSLSSSIVQSLISSYSLYRHVQCVLNFAENVDNDGGTLVVPFFHRYLRRWCENNSALRRNIPWLQLSKLEEEKLLRYAHRVTMREVGK